MICDEPTSALDTENEKDILNKILEMFNDISKIVVSHNMSTLKICDSVYELKSGNLFLTS